MKRRVLSLLLAAALVVSVIVTAAAINTAVKTDDEVITATIEYLRSKEGNYNSVNADDNGAVSIGILQWHGPQALELLKRIVAMIPDYALEVLGESFYNEIVTATNWNTRTVNAEEKAALIVLLSTDESAQAQLAKAKEDISGYLSHAKKMGLNTPALQLYFMDIQNQYGAGGAERMLRYAKEASGLSEFNYVTEFHNGMRKAAYQLEYNNSVTPYMPRRESTYTHIVEKLGWETDVPYCIMTARCGAEGDKHVSIEIKDGSFVFPENPYTKEGYTFAGWNMHRKPSDTWYIANIGWCTAKWITQQGYTKCLYQPGQTQQIDSKFLSSGSQGAVYLLEPVWIETVTPNTCTHSWKEETVKAATCTDGGTIRYVCSKCGTEGDTQTTLPAGHQYGSWTVLQTASCTSAGLRTRTCSVCGMSQTETAAKTQHRPGSAELAVPPTCTTEGRREVKCLDCGTVLQTQTVPALGHQPGQKVTDQLPTCKTPGMEHIVCERCGTVVYAEELPAQHTFSEWQTYTPATALGDGTCTRRCTVCGLLEIRKIPGETHTHVYTVTTVEPTCTESGYALYTCGCGEYYTEYQTEPLGHKTYDVVTEETCCTDGFSICTCVRCHGTWLESGEKAYGHNWDGGTVTTYATQTAEGIMTFTCLSCGEKKTETYAHVSPCTGGTGCPGSRFEDMSTNWAHEGLDFCVERGLLSGISDTQIAPNVEMTRSMLVAVLYRLEGSPAVSGDIRYSDVPANIWYDVAVQWATKCNIVSGVGGNLFAPNDSVTREQIATVLFRYAIYKDYDFSAAADMTVFPDWDKTSAFARVGLQWAVGAGLVSGRLEDGKTSLDPRGSAARAEVASILMRLVRSFG